jgi:hypothetical protein
MRKRAHTFSVNRQSLQWVENLKEDKENEGFRRG